MVFSTQQSIDIAGVRDGVVVMKDGSFRLILQVNAINFALKSEQEQNSLIMQYQSFLNSLHFPLEIVIRSRRLDLTPYLKMVSDQAKKQTNELIRMQTDDYVDFVTNLIGLANIMKKNFYVVVAFSPMTVHQVSFLDKFFSKAQVFDHIKLSDEEFKLNTDKLKERAAIIASGLGSMGLHCFQLSTEEIIEMFYEIYNPDESSKERLGNAENLNSPIIVSKSEISQKIVDLPAEEKNDNMIDNSSLVKEQQKQEAELRKAESDKVAEKEVRRPEDAGTPAPTAEPITTAPATTIQTDSTAIPTASAKAGTPPAVQPASNIPTNINNGSPTNQNG